jgi:hypothetical protein
LPEVKWKEGEAGHYLPTSTAGKNYGPPPPIYLLGIVLNRTHEKFHLNLMFAVLDKR